MPNVKFYIDKSNQNNQRKAPIKANISLDKKNFVKIIDHCFVSDWNKTQQRVRPPKTGMKDNGHKEINDKLDKIQDEFKALVKGLEAKEIPITQDIVKKFLNGEKLNFGQGKEFWEAYREYLSLLSVRPKTLQSYTLYYTKLQEFEKETGYIIHYRTINQVFLDNYKKYILETKGLGWNTLATAIKKLKIFMNWSFLRKYHQEKDFKDLSVTEKRKTHISLTEEELSRLYYFDFKNQRLNQTRDIFCFSCLTSLPYSDLRELKHEHINNGILLKHRKKTFKRFDQPIHPLAISITKKYENQYFALPRISNQKLNEYIREICMIAGINTPTAYLDYSEGKIIERIAPKYELITSHIGRKTFATIYYGRTSDSIGVQKSAGMSAQIMREHYVEIKPEQAKSNIEKAFQNIKPKDPDPGTEWSDYVI